MCVWGEVLRPIKKFIAFPQVPLLYQVSGPLQAGRVGCADTGPLDVSLKAK